MKTRIFSGFAMLSIMVTLLMSVPREALGSTIWPATTIPGIVDSGPDSAVELGVKFRADTGGVVSGIRFYKALTNTGTHTGSLWTAAGTRLATATFSNETASGWQQVNFATPVAISANTIYVASYHTGSGHYSDDQNYFASAGVDNAPLHAPADGASGVNGVYAYGSGGIYPNLGWNSSNYWVDVVFSATTSSDSTPPTVTAFTISATASALTVAITSFTAMDNVAVSGYLITESAGTPSATASGWTAIAPTSYTFGTAGSKTLYAWAKDASGNVSAGMSATVTITIGSQGIYTIWPGTATPAIVDSGPDKAVEVGVKFRSDTSGSLSGIRFYKAGTNTGTHIGSLWTATGTLLATATFSNETASGWQQVNFATPVSISANTVYVASYHTSSGHYSCDQGFFANGVDSPPLHALANGVSGVNGVYAYGTTSRFPSQGWKSSNYWVDVVFNAATSSDVIAPTVTAFTIPSSASSLTVAITSLAATDNVGVTGYLVNEAATKPAATTGGWTTTAPTSYTFATAGNKTLYAWAKDVAGNVSAGRSAAVTIIVPSTGLEPVGWYAGDMHVHRSCGGSPEAVSSVLQKMNPQNLAVISLLADMGNGEVQDLAQDLPRVNGQNDPVSTSGRIVHWDAEWHWDPVYYQYPHQALGGHIVALGLMEAHQIWEEYTYPIFNWAHQQNGIAGFAHMQYLPDSIPQSLNCCIPLEYPVEIALGAADFVSLDVVNNNFTASEMKAGNAINAYYRLLNCGFRPGLAAGTDHPCNDGTTVGSPLTYAQVAGGEMTYQNWIEGIALGRTVVSLNGHNEFLNLTVNGSATPGDEIRLTGGGSVQVTVTWTANQNLSGTIELVHNGVVVASRQASAAAGSPASLSATVDFARSGWLAARRMGSSGHQLHTAAVFVTVDNAPVRASAEDAQFFVQWIDNLLTKTSPGGAWSSYFVNSRTAAQARYQSAKALYQQIALEAGSGVTPPPPPQDGTIFTSQTPDVYENDSDYELGTRFWSDVNGQVSQVRLYTNALEGGAHTVRIWRASDQTVVAGPYTWNIASGSAGWKSFALPTPLNISANTDYIVAVSNSSDRYYAGLLHGFDAPIVNGHLRTYTGSGVFSTVLGAMPTSTWNNTNYFRDVVFSP